MNIYEEIMILSPELDEKGVEDIFRKVNEIITSKGGEVIRREDWGIKKLAYELNRYQKGYYILILFRSLPSVIPDLERMARVTEQVIKIMVVKIKKKRHIDAIMSSIKSEEPASATPTLHEGGDSVEVDRSGGEDVQ